MKRAIFLPLFLLTLIGLVLAGCIPAPGDPYSLQAAGNQYLDAAHSQMTATAESAIRANEAAILVQAQTQASNDNAATATAQTIHVAATGTALYFEAQSTQAAATAQAIATQEAQSMSATRQAVELAQLQTNATATQQAQINQAEAESARLAREKVVTVGAWLAVFVGAVIAFILVFRLVDMLITTAARQRSWIPGADSFAWETEKGLTIIQPRKMFQPALQLESKSGAATMPQLTAPELQMFNVLAVHAVELQREISKRAQWFTPIGKSGQGETFVPMVDNTPAPALPMPELKPLPLLTGRHVLIAGPTGAGKTHAANYLLQARENVTVLDPHDDGATWAAHCRVIGGGRDFHAIGDSIKGAAELLDNRFKMRELGPGAHFDPVTLAIDELPAIVAHDPDVSKQLMQIGMEGRKVGIFLILLTHSVLVRSLGIEGQGDLRDNFATVKLDPLPSGVSETTPRQCTVIIGNLNKPESQDKYLVPALVPSVPTGPKLVPALVPTGAGTGENGTGTRFPQGNQPPHPATPEESELIKSLAVQGFGAGKIADLLGGRRKDTLERIRATLGAIAI